MFQFIGGFVVGVILKNKVSFLLKKVYTQGVNVYHNAHKNKKPVKKKSKIYLICKIKDKNEFDELFGGKLNPRWIYHEHKGVLKIEVDDHLDEYISYDDFLETTDLDIPLFQSFSEIFIYVHYFINEKEYINVYPRNTNINAFDFKLNDTFLSKKYESLICATVNNNEKTVYITKYFKMFLNNKTNITAEMILLGYDKLDVHLNNNINLILLNGKIINITSLAETI